MKKLILSLLFLLLIPSIAHSQFSHPPQIVEEEDGSPSDFYQTIKVTNGTLTDNGDGTASLSTGGGGGGGGSAEWRVDGTNLEPNLTNQGNNVDLSVANTLFVDDSTGRLGIGTTSPDTKLHVSANSGTLSRGIALFAQNGITTEDGANTGTATKGVMVQGDGGAYWIARDVTNNIEGLFGTANSGDVFMGSFTSHGFQARTNNVTRAEWSSSGNAIFNESGASVDHRFEGDTDSSLLFLDGSEDSVGIGTTSPTAKLDINGDLTVASDLTVTRNAVVYNRLSVNTEQADGNLNVSGSTQLETLDFTTLEGDFSMDSQAVNSIETGINHDNLTGFVAGEHINWTNTTSDFSTTGDAHVGGDLTVNGSIKQGSGAGGTVTLDGSLSVADNLTVTEQLNIYGNIGIGIAQPARQPVHIHNPATSSTSYVHFTSGDTGATSSDGTSIGVFSGGGFAFIQREAQNMNFSVNGSNRIEIESDGGILMLSLASGTTQGAAGAGANELWVDTDDGNTIKLGT